MANKRRAIAVVLIAAAVGGMAWLALRPGEPLYQGRTMSSWLNGSSPSGVMDNEMQVWQSFRSNAVPFLRKKLNASDGRVKKAYCAVRQHLPEWMSRRLPAYDSPPTWVLRWHAADGLGYIGDAAAPAIPDLIRMFKTETSGFFPQDFLRVRAVAALGNIGQKLKPSDPSYQAVTEALIAASKDSDLATSSLATNDLKQHYPEAAARAGIK